MATINELKWQTMTAAVNEIRSPNRFVSRLLWGNRQTVNTEDISIDTVSGGRQIAPFVRKNGEAIMVGGISEKFATVAGTNIRIKRPLTPSELLFGRRPGTVIFPTVGQQVNAIQQHIARDLQFMADMVTNAEEYLACMALRGAISYEQADKEVFTITFPRSADANITLTTFWDDAVPGNVRIFANIHLAKQVASDNSVPTPTDIILGTEAAAAFLELVESGSIKLLTNENNGLVSVGGGATFVSQFNDDGAIYLGSLGGMRIWEYRRTALLDGTAVDMIRPKYAEFVSTSPAAERVMYFSAIPDMKTLQGRLFQAERFSKSWEEEDPSVYFSLIHSRPLPVPRRPNANISMKVVSG